jgi:hypothetical protein
VVCVQLLFTLAFIGAAKLSGLLQVDPLRMKFVIPYLFYIVLFRYIDLVHLTSRRGHGSEPSTNAFASLNTSFSSPLTLEVWECTAT